MARHSSKRVTESRWLARRSESDFLREVESGVRRGEFFPTFKPVATARTGDLVELQTVVRWAHPMLGLVGGAEFIPRLADGGHLAPLSLAVLRAACLEALEWPRFGPRGLQPRLRFTLSTSELATEGAVLAVVRAVRDVGLPAGRLIVRVVDSPALLLDASATGALGRLREAGVLVSVGSGCRDAAQLLAVSRVPADEVGLPVAVVQEADGQADVQGEEGSPLGPLLAGARDRSAVIEGVDTLPLLHAAQRLGDCRVSGAVLGEAVPLAGGSAFDTLCVRVREVVTLAGRGGIADLVDAVRP